MTKLSIDVWSDIACPWCYLGKASLERALRSFPHRDDVAVVLHAYQLDPTAPERATSTMWDHMTREKGMPEASVRDMFAALEERGRALGLEYRFDRVRPDNTRRAHRLLRYALSAGRQGEVADALFRAYFVDGASIGSDDELVRVAVEAGLDEADARSAVSSAAYDSEVKADIDQAERLGITGVPFFVLAERFGVSGAQTPEVFGDVLDRVWAAGPAASAATV